MMIMCLLMMRVSHVADVFFDGDDAFDVYAVDDDADDADTDGVVAAFVADYVAADVADGVVDVVADDADDDDVAAAPAVMGVGAGAQVSGYV